MNVKETILDINKVLSIVSSDFTDDKKKGYIGLHEVKVQSRRIATIKNNPKCTCCGLNVRLAKVESSGNENPHLNFYGYEIVNNGMEEVLFTRDHIVPYSFSEDDSKENSQTLCVRCNQLKNDEFISNEELLVIRNKYKDMRNKGIKHNDVMKQLVK